MNNTRSTLLPFFIFSLLLHFLFILIWPKASKVEKVPEPISVAFLPLPKESPPKPPEKSIEKPIEKPIEKVVPKPIETPVPKAIEKPTVKPIVKPTPEPIETPVKKTEEPNTRPSKAPVEIAKKSTLLPEEPEKTAPEIRPEKERKRPEPKQPSVDREQFTILQRPLPSLKELLPPPTWSASRDRSSGREEPIRLDTREPKYITYFNSIKRAIELVWEYPEPALRHGVQGKLVLEFTILANGSLEAARLIRSSGFSVLDQEALRAVTAASPFHAIPPWIGKNRLDIIASFEYLDNRLNHRFSQ